MDGGLVRQIPGWFRDGSSGARFRLGPGGSGRWLVRRRRGLPGATLSKLIREQGIEAIPRGFRQSFRDWCGETDRPRQAAATCLAHSVNSKTRPPMLDRTCSNGVGHGRRLGRIIFQTQHRGAFLLRSAPPSPDKRIGSVPDRRRSRMVFLRYAARRQPRG